MEDKISELRELALKKNFFYAKAIPLTSKPFCKKQDVVVNVLENCQANKNIDESLEMSNNENEKSQELVDLNKPKNKEFMKDYFQKIEIIKSAMNEMECLVERIRELKLLYLRAISTKEEKEISNELNHVLKAVQTLTSKTKKALIRLKEENNIKSGDEKEENISLSSSEDRIRTNIYNSVVLKFRGILVLSQNVQTELKQDVNNKVARQIKFVYPDASDIEVAELIDKGDMSAAAAIQTQISGEHESLRCAIGHIEDKYRDIKMLQQSVEQLHEMFLEMNNLVEHQGELINQIEYSVNQAKDYTEKAETELLTARKHQETTKKRLCWITTCMLILVVVIMIPILIQILK